MEELSHASRLARRFALAATICCSAASGYADGPATKPAPSQSFRSLLTQGWDNQQPAEKVDTPAAPIAVSKKAAIVRPALKIIEVPDPAFSTHPRSEPKAGSPKSDTREETSPPSTMSFAELIKKRAVPLVVQVPQDDAATINIEFAPSVNRVDVEKQIVANTARDQQESDPRPNVRAADPIDAEPIDAEPIQKQPVVAVAVPKIVTGVEAAANPIAGDVVPPALIDAPVRLGAEPAEMEPAEMEPAESPLVRTESSEASLADSQRAETQRAETDRAESEPSESELAATNSSPTDSEMRTAENEIGLPPLSDRSRRIASNGGFELFPLKDFEDGTATRLEVGFVEPSLTATIHATRLREVAQESIRSAQHRLERRATYSAKKYAVEALRSIVAMRDAESGGNEHAKQLEAAFDAIRESGDFCGRFGALDHNALQRMVTVHETAILKDRDLEHFSELQATESYLAVARTNLVLAAGGVREASDALVLLGQIEKRMSNPGDTHAAAVAVTLQRAAVEIEPTSAVGYRELGATLLSQGLVEQAAWALNRSVEIQPSRSGYQRLLEASRRLGDIDTARVCLTSLEDPQLPSEIRVHELTAKEFAATYRPNPATLESVNAKPKSNDTKEPPTDSSRISLRSLFPFGRR